MLIGEQTPASAPIPREGRREAAGYEELGQSLVLLRASTMKMVRLQLAMERRDRRTAMETLDELVMLDGRIRDLLTAMPPDAADPPMQRQLDEERNTLVRERLLLAAGTRGPALAAEGPQWLEPEPAAPPPPERLAAGAQGWTVIEEDAAPGGGRTLLFLALLLVVSALVGAAALFGTAAGRDLLALISNLGA